ncbi:MAG: PaaI family thioesterase [Candidatus Schekmanbacteria bacterium]|nr:PaaI family thioesterase [Candidatus Schekmanbacteria bacterium]
MTAPRGSELDRIAREAPFVAALGLELDRVDAGTCESVLEVRPDHLQQDGYVHAGVLATMADHTAGAAAASVMAEDRRVLTAEFKIMLLQPARAQRLRCVAKVLRAGRRLSFVESEVFGTTGESVRLVAKASVTIAIVERASG